MFQHLSHLADESIEAEWLLDESGQSPSNKPSRRILLVVAAHEDDGYLRGYTTDIGEGSFAVEVGHRHIEQDGHDLFGALSKNIDRLPSIVRQDDMEAELLQHLFGNGTYGLFIVGDQNRP